MPVPSVRATSSNTPRWKKLARTWRGRCRTFDALHQLLDRRSLAQVDELVGIRHAKINLVARLQFMLQNFFAIHEHAMTAAHVFEHPTAIYGNNLGLLAANAAVAERQFVAGLPADAEGRGVQRHIAANAARFNYNNARGAWHGLKRAPPRSARPNPPPGAIQHDIV